MEDGEKWFTQKKQFGRPVVNSWKGAAASGGFLAAFVGTALLFLSLKPFEPMNAGLIGLWLLTMLALLAGFHFFVWPRTERIWLTQDLGERQ